MTIPKTILPLAGDAVKAKWHGCYDEGWKNVVTPESISHPAKFSRALIRKILDHAIERGWLKTGDTVLDPFGGVGLGSLDALANGINWIGVELEPRFVDMAAGCDCKGMSRADWIRFYGRWARANHKDGRHWCPQCVAEAGRVIEPSPQMSLFDVADPGASYVKNSGKIPSTRPHRYSGNLGRFRRYARHGARAVMLQGDSRQLGQIVRRMAATISSPPYAGSRPESNGPGIDLKKQFETYRATGGGMDYQSFVAQQQRHSQNYGQTAGQLGSLPEGRFDSDMSGMVNCKEGRFSKAVMKSPPYAELRMDGGRIAKEEVKGMAPYSGESPDAWRTTRNQDNLGNLADKGFDFVLSSPPYANNTIHGKDGIDSSKFTKTAGQNSQAFTMDDYGQQSGQLAKLPEGDVDSVVASPPFAGNSGGRGQASREGIDPALFDRHSGGMIGGMGDQAGNLGNLAMKDDLDSLISSPPFGQQQEGGDGIWEKMESHHSRRFTDRSGRKSGYQEQGASDGQLAGLPEGNIDSVVASPPFSQSVGSDDPAKRGGLYRDPKRSNDTNLTGTYGSQPGQLAAMPEGRFDSGIPGMVNCKEGDRMAATISSPPYVSSLQGDDRQDYDDAKLEAAKKKGDILQRAEWGVSRGPGVLSSKGYGQTAGQLGQMKEGDIQAITSSPPYEASVNQHDTANDTNRRIQRMAAAGIDVDHKPNVGGPNDVARQAQTYGNQPGNIGAEAGETFWQAAKTIVEQCYQVMKPGGVSIWVAKDFVRDGQRVPFCDQWRLLCESAGFVHIETFRAMLVKHKGTQVDLAGDSVELTIERKSFFRRLAEKNGSPRIDWEEVICLRKP